MKDKGDKKLPLEGIRVLDQTIVWAGPYATMLLADMGAEVIRVESTNFFPYVTRGHYCRPSDSILKSAGLLLGGYPGRKAGERPWNRNPFFNLHARNKLSVTVKLNTEKGREIFKRLVKISDCIVENYGYGAMDRLGLGYDVLKEVNPKIIFVSMAAFGNRGSWKGRLALGRHLEHIAGHTLLRKYPDLEPDRLSDIYHCDATGGAIGAFAALIGIYYRMRTGKGQFIDVSLIETIIPQLGEAVMDYVMNRRIRESLGNRDEWAAPCGVYRCQGEDRWVAITVFDDEQWVGLCKAIGNPPWTFEERFSSQIGRWKNQDELDRLIESWTRDKEDYHVVHLLQKEGVPASPVMDELQYFKDPHLQARGFFERVTQVDSGTHLYPGMPWKMSNTQLAIRKPPCRLGEHNEYVYKDLLGFTEREYQELVQEGHIGMDYDETILLRGGTKKG